MSNFIENVKTKVYCRLGVSKIHGIGVFAIKTIPVGINPLEVENDFPFEEVSVEDVKNQLLQEPLAVHRLILDMCPENDGVFSVPSQGLNGIGIAWYLNHSDTPNMEERDGNFFSIKPISSMEELTVDYGTYGKLNL